MRCCCDTSLTNRRLPAPIRPILILIPSIRPLVSVNTVVSNVYVSQMTQNTSSTFSTLDSGKTCRTAANNGTCNVMLLAAFYGLPTILLQTVKQRSWIAQFVDHQCSKRYNNARSKSRRVAQCLSSAAPIQVRRRHLLYKKYDKDETVIEAEACQSHHVGWNNIVIIWNCKSLPRAKYLVSWSQLFLRYSEVYLVCTWWSLAADGFSS